MRTKRHTFIEALALVTSILTTASVVHSQTSADAPKPNIVFIIADDCTYP
ncbi:MAG: hypothetical protein P8J33_07355 [Pirellulaceae bacterium]|nr:hypothetical protein [Pirellulaceae bacterium]